MRLLLGAIAFASACSSALADGDLPPEYRAVEWIESTGTQMIDTEHVFKGEALVVADMMLMTADDKDVAGVPNNSGPAFIVDYKGTQLYYRYASTERDDSAAFPSIVGRWVAVEWGVSAKHDGVVMSTATHGTDFSANTQTFRLFGARSGSYSSVRFKRVKMYDAGELVRDLQPVFCVADGQAGMYDFVRGKFHFNAGSGAFKYAPPTLQASDVIRLDWLESTGTQFIDTGVVFTNTPLVEARMMLRTDADKDVAGTAEKKPGCFIVDYKGNTLYYRYSSETYVQSAFASIVDTWVDCSWGPSAKHGDAVVSTCSTWDFSANSQTFRLFGARAGTYSSVRFGPVAMWDGDEFVRDLVPVRLRLCGQLGMYDRVSGLFFPNAGSGDFLPGPDATTPDELLVSADRAEVGSPSPAYGAVYDLAPGDAFTCTAPSETIPGEPGFRYACTGWTLYTNAADGASLLAWRSGRGQSLDYVHPGRFVKLEWNWSVERDPTRWSSDSYAQDGLVAQWDGWENAGRAAPHDPAAAMWVDLSGNGHTLGSFVSGSGWTTNAFTLPNSGYSVASKIVGAPLVSTQVVSMEIVYREIYRRNTATLLFAVAGSGSTGWKGFTWYDTWIGFQTGGSGWTFSQPRSYPQPIRTVYVGYPSAESAAAEAFWADGVRMSARSGSDTWNQTHTGFGYTANANWAMQGEVYSVRVYNRKLTDDEIRRHSRIDDFRFRGVVHGDELHVASAMGEYGTANPAYGSVSYGHVAGEEVVCTAPEEHDPGDGSYHARCTGYNLYTNVPGGDAWFPWTSGSASTCVFQFPESSVKVEWTWKVEAPKRLDFNDVAAVTTSSALLALEIGGYGAEASSAKLMVAWGFAPDALAFTNVLLETAVPATSFDALEFGGLFPGSEIHARIFLLDDLGGVVEQSGPPFSFTTASDSVPTAADYAPGLVAMWDGVENLGPGLGDLSARKWFDHVGDVDLDLIGSGAFTGDGLSMNGPSAVGVAAAPPFRAMELVLHEDSRSVAYAVPFASGINNLLVERANTKDGFIFEAGTDSMMLPVPFDAAALRTWSANYNESRHVSRTFLDGAYAANGTHKDTWGSQDKVVCVGAYKRSDTGYPFRGTMHSIRLYDHELTDAEIARNRAVDVARFVSKNPVYEVRSAQREYGVVYPDWGAHAGLAAGGSVKFYAPDMALPGGLRVHARGCRIYRADASRADWRLDSEVDSNSFEFFQGNSSARVVWDWLVQGPDGLEAPEQTAATDASASLAVRVVGFGFDATNAALCVAWGFEPGVYPFTNVLDAAALPGTTCTNVLAGLAPAARYRGSFFLVDSDGRLAAETPDFEFSTASRPPVPGLDLDALPDGSRILEWVEFNGSTYVDTGIVPSGHEVRMTYETTTWVNDGYVFGTDDGSTYMHWTEYASNGQLASALYYWGCNNAQYNWGHVAVNVVHDLDFNLKNGSAYETWLDGEKTSFNALSRSSKTLQIARRGSSGVKWKGRVYGFSMLAHATGEEVLRYFPASDPAGKACFWDAVARAFVYPASGTLAAGPAVVTAADSALVVTGWPLEYGAPAPGYGAHLFADGSRVAAWAGDFEDGTFRAEVLGCNVYVNALGVWEFAEWKEGRSFELAQSGSGVKLEWRFMARDLPRLEFNGVVETNATAATLAVDVGGWGFAASNASLCVAWGFRPDELLYTNVLVDAAWAGLSTNVVFGGRAPGSRYYARVFLRDSEGGVVETADPEPFTFKTPRSGTGGGGTLVLGENLIQNPSFEANQDWSKNGYAYASATKQPAGWSFSTGSGLAWSGATWNAGGLPDGNYAAYVQMNGWAKTTVEVPRRAVYGFSYWYVRRANQPVGHKITVSVDGVEITNVTIVAANNTFVKLPEIELVLTAGAHEIFFQGYTAGSDITTCIDLVDLHAVRSLDDEVEVVGNPREYGEPNPDYGMSDGIAAGEAFTVQAYDFTDGTLEAKVKGYVVYTNDVSSGTRGVYLSGMREDLSVGNGFSCPYVHQDGYCGIVEWLWSVHDVPGLVFNDVVETNTANATLDVEISGWGYTGESAQLKMAYGFSPDFLQYTNVLWDAVVPRTATNIFATGFIPGQHYFLRLFLEADDGTIVDCGVTRELET
ncbi:MAG: hypothetical protein MJ138_02275, partial [Kiritimatiellae bacterium]|nr:hypothetical protein [Kiritimatiellia bacterium]